MISSVRAALERYIDPKRQAFMPIFFKTGKGEYAEGDIFLGVTVPQVRTVAKECKDLSFPALEKLLKDPIHEVRLTALIILCDRFEKEDEKLKKKIVQFYLSHLKGVNNWDLVDLSSYKILGEWLLEKDRNVLYKLAKSKNLWEQRIAIVSTLAFIRRGDFHDTFMISEMLLSHRHDLIHKAVGWMLREVGKKNDQALRMFLSKHAKTMPRTALRYAIERFGDAERQKWMKR